MKFRLVGWLASIVASATIVCAIASGAGAANSPAAFNAMFQPPASDGKPIDVAVGLLLNFDAGPSDSGAESLATREMNTLCATS